MRQEQEGVESYGAYVCDRNSLYHIFGLCVLSERIPAPRLLVGECVGGGASHDAGGETVKGSTNEQKAQTPHKLATW